MDVNLDNAVNEWLYKLTQKVCQAEKFDKWITRETPEFKTN